MIRPRIPLKLALRAWTPARLPGLKQWLSATTLDQLRDGDPVTVWDDRSGRGNHATATTSGVTYRRAGAGTNGLPAVALDGTSGYLSFPNADLASLPTFGIYLVIRRTGAGGANPRLWQNDVANVSITTFEGTGGGEAGAFLGSTGAGFVATSTTPLSVTWSLLEISYDGTALRISRNGTTIAGPGATVGAPPTPTGSSGYIGGEPGGSQFAGEIAEALVYSPALGTGDEARLTGYLMARYGL